MRLIKTTLALSLLLLGLAGPAHAVLLGFMGTLSLEVGTLPPISTRAAGVGDFTISGGEFVGLTLAGGTFATSVTIPITDPAVAPISSVSVSSTNGAGVFSTIPGGNINNNFVTNLTGTGSGPMAVSGVAKVGLFPGPLANLSVPFTSGGVNGIGLGGNLVTASGFGLGVSVRGAPWTTGTASIGTATAMGFVSPDGIQLVTPIFLSTTIGASPVIPTFATLTLSFAPEPGTLLLVASGVAGLALLGRRAARR